MVVMVCAMLFPNKIAWKMLAASNEFSWMSWALGGQAQFIGLVNHLLLQGMVCIAMPSFGTSATCTWSQWFLFPLAACIHAHVPLLVFGLQTLCLSVQRLDFCYQVSNLTQVNTQEGAFSKTDGTGLVRIKRLTALLVDIYLSGWGSSRKRQETMLSWNLYICRMKTKKCYARRDLGGWDGGGWGIRYTKRHKLRGLSLQAAKYGEAKHRKDKRNWSWTDESKLPESLRLTEHERGRLSKRKEIQECVLLGSLHGTNGL